MISPRGPVRTCTFRAWDPILPEEYALSLPRGRARTRSLGTSVPSRIANALPAAFFRPLPGWGPGLLAALSLR
jgi:hypothetical protein